jgi:hypothetical protein
LISLPVTGAMWNLLPPHHLHSDQSDTDDEDDEVEEDSTLHLLPAAKSISNNMSVKESVNEPHIPIDCQANRQNLDSNTRQLNSSLYTASVLSAQPYDGVLSLTCSSPEHYKLQEDTEKELELGMKKEFDDVGKLRADQKKNMQRAKDLLKAAFSESESEPEESETEDENQSEGEDLSEIIDDIDTDMT